MILSTKPRLLYHKYKNGSGIRVKKFGRAMVLNNHEALVLAVQIVSDAGYRGALRPRARGLKLNG